MTLEVDLGEALPLSTGGETTLSGLAAGAALGYQKASGWGFSVRYDTLGLSSPLVDGASTHQLALSARYILPFHVPEPFLELMCGPAMSVTSSTAASNPLAPSPVSRTAFGFGGAIGAGAALPLGRHFSVGLVARDWLVGVSPAVFHVPSVRLFLNANFGALFN